MNFKTSLQPQPQPRSRSRIRHSRDLNQTTSSNLPHDLNQADSLDYPYSFDLSSHQGCVNAICFSNSSQGRWLATAGDDTIVLLWDLFGDFDQITPVAAYDGPEANIFSVDFTIDGNRILATGLDSRIYVWDLERSGRSLRPTAQTPKASHPSRIITPHTTSCRRVACHPRDPDVFLSASEDGTVAMTDLRESLSTVVQPLLSTKREYSDVLWNPYTTDLVRPNPMRRSRPEISSIAFDETGQLLAAMMSKWFPTVWAIDGSEPVAVLKSGRHEGVDGQRWGFRDTCTIKHGSFSNASHSRTPYFAAGSDDFRCYGWKLPPLDELKERRVRVNNTSSWLTGSGSETTGYGRNPITIPAQIDEPSFILSGHRSIPNSVAFHPIFPFVCTAGVEKVVKIHSAQELGHHRRSRSRVARRTPSEVRKKVSTIDELGGEAEEDRETLVMFDQLLLRNELEPEELDWIRFEFGDSGSSESDDGLSESDESEL
ncbi:hypothetical protein CROQUDRAFT_661046 [Cronartium quercuum f. sp. fusiforme G11]|uniref:WD40 repeat-like protein n=1 Tax=Cronartium quercuum f. sp. fusiforme G11 TaxID=708437 RepID=A0A9P6T8Y1_9BASI|nr:hypothetical protein CROQUDRAFT_661046 [Cronartium quercuum f. sp. fusiforme G11]